MHQSFITPSEPEQGEARLTRLRAQMMTHGVQAYLVPRSDMFQGEYVAPCDERLAWLTGFTGSAGFCAALQDRAGVFVDGRYHVQVEAQVCTAFTPVHWPQTMLADWLIKHLPRGAVVGYDAWLYPAAEIRHLRGVLQESGIELESLERNLIDKIWEERPLRRTPAFFMQDVTYTGETAQSKCARIAKTLRADHALMTQPDSIAWLLNIRGRDTARNPVPHCFAILNGSGQITIYAQPEQVQDLMFEGGHVQVRAFERFLEDVSALGATVQFDPKTCPDRIAQNMPSGGIWAEAPDPCALPKACKTSTELKGAMRAHVRDGTAVVRCLSWLAQRINDGSPLSEIDVVRALEGFRQETGKLEDISFDTICGSGPNGAIVHYRVSHESNREIQSSDLLLIDSGGQYRDGTTDVTRTLAIGTPSAEQKEHYTRVLKGMIALSRARFPKGVSGQRLDAIARQPLWEAGLDYDHGTGHGVGSYLCVHEGPQSISAKGEVALAPGMIVSNEPGYYRKGAYGIRIENLIHVVPDEAASKSDGRDMLAFETLTLVPFDRRLIDMALLSSSEQVWIDSYHQRVLDNLQADLSKDDQAWLAAACTPLLMGG